MLTAKGAKPVSPFLHRFDNLYLFGAFSPITGCSHLLEMPHCKSNTFQYFLDYMAVQNATEIKILLLDNEAFHHAERFVILKTLLCYSYHLTLPNLIRQKKCGDILKTK